MVTYIKNGLTAPNLLANISQMELNETFCSMIFMRLGLKILCGDFGEFLIIFVACESFYHF
jgi:hypothetical protein